jgi:uncharacterized protein (TIGR03118 family)
MKIAHLSHSAARILLFASVTSIAANAATNFVQRNLVADVAGVADNTDPNLVGTWGVATSPTGVFWVSNTSNGTSTLYNSLGVPSATVVTVPPSATRPGAKGSPTGQVWNGLGVFEVAAGRVPSFIFATLDGTISGWNSAVGATAVVKVDNGASGAIYTGLAIGTSSFGPALYAANFAAGTIDVFDKNWAPLTVPGGFVDRDLPAGFSPSNIQRFGRRMYVTYNLPDGGGGFVYGRGTGLVNVFDVDGRLLQRLIPSHESMNIPWGVAVAGANFGVFSYSLLVGNFGNGTISAYDLHTGDYLGTMQDGKGNNLSIDGLWGIQFGNGGNGGDATALYFFAAPSGGDHGLVGSLKPASDSTTP